MMKKLLFSAVVILCLASCSEDLTDYFTRVETLEKKNQAVKDDNDKLEDDNARLEDDNAQLEAENAKREAENAERQRILDATAGRNEERESWNAEMAQRNAEQGVQRDSLSDVVSSLQNQRDEQIQANDDINERNAGQAQQNEEQKQRNEHLRLQWEELLERLADLEEMMTPVVEPKLLSMEFVVDDNPSLTQRIPCTIVGDSVIECWLPGIVSDKTLKPRFTFEGTMVVIDGFEAESGKTAIDFTRPRTVAVTTLNKNKYYTIYVHSYTGLPILYLNTNSGAPVTSKDYYVSGHLKLVEDVKTRAAGDVVEAVVNIKGRGNSSWKFDKKPYRLKFNEKYSLLGMHKDKSWVLIPNYNDKSMIRNSVAFYMGKISTMDYTPEAHFVELIFNGAYQGTYMLCEKIKISNHRVAVGDDGFLLEIDSRAPSEADSRYFPVSHIENVVAIKEPDVAYGDANFNYVRDFVALADAILFSSNYRDPVNGWQKYLDMDSFVDWYLINEIGKNLDSYFDTSCYMHLARGGKLMMGPVWDMDVAFGNMSQANQTCFRTTGFYIKNVNWYRQLFSDPAFVKRVKERFNYFYYRRNDIYSYINADAQYLKYSAEENEKKWGTLNTYTWPNYDIWGSYQNEVQSLKEWINARMEWLRTEINNL